jgi:phage tail sheath protein FI
VAGVDGTILPKTGDLIGSESLFTGINALEKVDLFNILCIPDATRALASDPKKLDSTNVDPNSIFGAAMTYCKKRRAFLLVDPLPEIGDVASAVDWISSGLTVHDANGAAYFPRLKLPDPLNNFQVRVFAPCGVVAGLYSRTDVARGVWKAPAGTEARLTDVQATAYTLTDGEIGVLNPLGLNCFRTFAGEASEWKYVPVRRLALFLEESLYRGTQWVVFEPNDEPLWAQIRINLGAFMQNLFRQGAFQGKTPAEAYFVKCDKETTTQTDINLGIVNIVVGFAPLKPAEFVIIKIQQIAGQIAA